MRLRIYRGTRKSRSARALARELGVRTIRTVGSRFRPRPSDVIVNWGCSELPAEYRQATVFNEPEAVRLAANKLLAFDRLSESGVGGVVTWSANKRYAAEWQERGSVVVVRHKLAGTGGEGIQIVRPGEEIPDAPLYTRYFKARDEYRIHVFDGQVIDRQQKRRRHEDNEQGQVVNEIRNLQHGWVYCREEVERHADLDENCIAAVRSMGLLFAAVDAKRSRRGYCGIMELNTAPGLEGSTVRAYTNAIRANEACQR